MNPRRGLSENLWTATKQKTSIICDLCFYTANVSPLKLVSWLEQFWSVCTEELFTICASTSTEKLGNFYSMASKSLFFFFLLGKKISFKKRKIISYLIIPKYKQIHFWDICFLYIITVQYFTDGETWMHLTECPRNYLLKLLFCPFKPQITIWWRACYFRHSGGPKCQQRSIFLEVFLVW